MTSNATTAEPQEGQEAMDVVKKDSDVVRSYKCDE
jgi:hypothetical protein